jgi:hypothetical protein
MVKEDKSVGKSWSCHEARELNYYLGTHYGWLTV